MRGGIGGEGTSSLARTQFTNPCLPLCSALASSSPRAQGFSWPMSSVLWVGGGTPSSNLFLGKLISLLITSKPDSLLPAVVFPSAVI